MSKLDDKFTALFAADGAKLAALPEGEKLTEARDMARALYVVDTEIKDLEAQLAKAKESRVELVQRTLPSYFDGIGVDKIGIPGSDIDLVVENYYHANIPEEKREEAFAWLEENGHGDLIKTILTMQFGRGELEIAQKVVQMINTELAKLNIEARSSEIKMSVPWNTLTAFVKEQHAEGVALPLETLGATIGRIVKLKQRKK